MLDQLGLGGMGAVYRALDTRLQREVAIKVLHRNLEISGARERFFREARTVSSLNHPNICTVFDIGEQDGDPYLVMELLHGESLKERIARGRIPADDLREVAFRTALALQVAHGRGIIHRDIKPANLFLVNDGQGTADIKVLDFGLAKIQTDTHRISDSTGITRHGATVGTVEYMSPEQACGEVLDARSDLFSLGAVLYEMATGVTPFRGATSAIIFSELLNREPVPPREKNLNLPADLDSIIRGLLVKDRAKRTQSAAALLQQLTADPVRASTPSLPSLAVKSAEPAGGGSSTAEQSFEIKAAPAPAVHVKPRPIVGSAAQGASSPTRGVLVTATSSSEEAAAVRSAEEEDEAADPLPAFGSRIRRGSDANTALPRRQSSRFMVVEDEEDAPAKQEPAAEASPGRRWFWVALALIAIAVLAAALFFALRHRTVGRVFTGALQMMPLRNQTGEPALERGPGMALQLLLQQSPAFAVRGIAPADYLDGGTDATLAQLRAGAPHGEQLCVLSGVLSRHADGYGIHVEVVDASSGGQLAAEDETAANLQEVPAALSRISGHLRHDLGEGAPSLQANGAELAQDGSLSFTALALFGEGEARLQAGDTLAALDAYTHALTLDAHLQVARVRRIDIASALHADIEARADMDVLAAEPVSGSPMQQMQRLYYAKRQPANAPEAALAIAEQWVHDRPHDASAHRAYAAERLRLHRYDAALVEAAAAADLNPYDRANQELLTRAEIASGHAGAAYDVQTHAFAMGVGSPGLSLAAAFLSGNQTGVASALQSLQSARTQPEDVEAELTYLSNTGALREAVTLAEGQTKVVRVGMPLPSAEVSLAATIAVNEALAGHCDKSAPEVSTPSEVIATLRVVREALCGRQTAKIASPSAGMLAPVRVAAEQLFSARSDEAFPDDEARSADAFPELTALLRARANLRAHRWDAAISEARAVLGHRGSAYLSGLITYPAAYAVLADAYAATGDQLNAASATAALHALWHAAAQDEPLLRPRAHSADKSKSL